MGSKNMTQVRLFSSAKRVTKTLSQTRLRPAGRLSADLTGVCCSDTWPVAAATAQIVVPGPGHEYI